MGLTVNLKNKGLYTAPNDLSGAPEGAYDVADNVVVDQRELLQSRRGLSALEFAFPSGADRARRLAVYQGKLFAHYGGDQIAWYDDNTGWQVDAGTFPSPNALLARSRFVLANKNLYVTTSSGLWKTDVFNAPFVRAGVPPGLDIEAALSGSSGFLQSNDAVSVTADIASGSPILTGITSVDGILEGQIVTGTGIPAGSKVTSVQDTALAVQTTATTSSGSTAMTVTSGTGIVIGQLVSGPGIQFGTKVANVVGLAVTLSLAATATVSPAETFSFFTAAQVTMSQNATGTTAGATVDFSEGSQVAYRALWGIRDLNGNILRGSPTQPAFLINDTGGSRDASVTSTIPAGITTAHFFQLYRSSQTSSYQILPDDEMQLVFETNPTSGDLTNGFITVTDQTPDALRGATLYTSPSVGGIRVANAPPPLARDLCVFRNFGIYANVSFKQRLNVTVTSVGAPNGLQVGDVLTIAGVPYTGAAAEDIANDEFAVVTSGTPAQNIADTVNSLIRVVNRSASNTDIYAYLLSDFDELPGQILFEERNPGGAVFSATASAHGSAYNPALPTSGTSVSSSADAKPNCLLIAKEGELEAVPEVNLFPIGSASNTILRVVALRDYVFVLTTEGIQRLTGTSLSTFATEPFDPTAVLIAPESACALGNQLYGLFNQGVLTVSDSGSNFVSDAIDNVLRGLYGTALDTIASQAFAAPYETDKAYLLWLPSGPGEAAATQCFRRNYNTSTWTRIPRAATTAFVHPTEDRLYIANDSDIVSVERKSATYRDYVDEGWDIDIVSYVGKTLVLTDAEDIRPGDIISQYIDPTLTVYSAVAEVDLATNTVVVFDTVTWDIGPAELLPAIDCVVQWKPAVGGNPAVVRQAAEGLVLFKAGRFYDAGVSFATDMSQSFQEVPFAGTPGGGWGTFPWGEAPWGGVTRPRDVRFYVPKDKQYGSQLTVRLRIRSGYSNWQGQGVSIYFNDIGPEVGK